MRERVRIFEETVKDMWCGEVPVTEGTRHNSKLDSLMKHRSLNAFRFRWFAHATSFPVVVTMLPMMTLYAYGTSLFSHPVSPDDFDLWLFLLTGVLLLIGASIYFNLHTKLDMEIRDYNAAIGKLAPRIDVLITNQLNGESSVVSENAAKIRAVVSRQDDMNQVSEGVKDTMRSWRRLERLPYYLRHAWDMYFVEVNDHRELPRHRNLRVAKFITPVLLIMGVSLWALHDAFAVLVRIGFEPAITALGLPLSQIILTLLLTIFYVLFFVYRYWPRARREVFWFELLTCLVMATFLVVMVFGLAAKDEAGARAAQLLSHVTLLIVVAVLMGLVFAIMADRGFKKTARIAPVQIVDALKTHKNLM